jgi:hypothetical protein
MARMSESEFSPLHAAAIGGDAGQWGVRLGEEAKRAREAEASKDAQIGALSAEVARLQGLIGVERAAAESIRREAAAHRDA